MKINIWNSAIAVRHFENLEKLGCKESGIETYVKLKRLENKATRLNESFCNGYINDQEETKQREKIEKQAKSLFKDDFIPCFYWNGDPRGYALKLDFTKKRLIVKIDGIEAEHTELMNSIYKDFGGYGILAPEF